MQQFWQWVQNEELQKLLQKILNSYFESLAIERTRAINFRARSHEFEHQLQVFVDSSNCAMAAKNYLRVHENNTKKEKPTS